MGSSGGGGVGIDNIMGRRANPDDPFVLNMEANTTDATPTELVGRSGEVLEASGTMGASAGMTGFEVEVVAAMAQSSNSRVVYWKASFVYEYGGSIVDGSVVKDRVSETDAIDEADWDIDFSHTITGTPRIQILVTGSATYRLNWRATVRATSLKSVVLS